VVSVFLCKCLLKQTTAFIFFRFLTFLCCFISNIRLPKINDPFQLQSVRSCSSIINRLLTDDVCDVEYLE